MWFRVPAEARTRLVRVDALTQDQQPDEAADLAVFVQPASGSSIREPQACDGPAARSPGSQEDAGAGVSLRVPAGRDLLVQVGRSAGQQGQSAVVSVEEEDVEPMSRPPADTVQSARRLQLGRAKTIPLRGATLTEEDPAQPACAASGTVWRKVRIARTGVHVAEMRGDRSSSVTAFLGGSPTGDNAVACRGGEVGLMSMSFRARRGQVAWLRVGTDDDDPGTARLAISGPCQQTPLRPIRVTRLGLGAASGTDRTARSLRIRAELAGPCLGRSSVTITRGGAVVARGVVGGLQRGARTIAVPRVRGRSAPAGTYRVTVRGRTTDRGRPVARTALVRLR